MTPLGSRAEGGQSLVEFALIVPLFALLMFGLIDFSRLLFTYVSVANGARELARSASVSTGWSNAAAIAAFNNSTIVAGSQNPNGAVTDTITVLVGSATCARTLDAGGTCTPAPTSSSPSPCLMPLNTATCTLPPPPQGGFVEVRVSYTFQFNPLFQSRLENISFVSFMRPTSILTTTARAYVE